MTKHRKYKKSQKLSIKIFFTLLKHSTMYFRSKRALVEASASKKKF